MTPRFEVADVVLWGKLVKMWATGKAYDGVPVMAQPRTVSELKRQCRHIKLKVTIPDNVTALVVLNHSEETLFLRIPPKSLVENSEAYLADPRTEYPDMQVYELFEEYEDENGHIRQDKKLDFHAARVGDYSIAQCC